MRSRPARIAAVWFAAGVQLFASIGFASDIVLCVADDGHIALETPHAAGPCLTDYNRHHPRASHLEVLDLEHHGCTDTLLSQPPAVRDRGASSVHATATRVVAAVLPPPPPLFSQGACEGRKSVTFLPGSDLTSLRTVVLIV